MERYIFLILFVLSMLLFVFYLYAQRMNKKLNQKKQSIGEKQSINRYNKKVSASFCVSAFLCTLSIVSFSVKMDSASINLLNKVSSEDEYYKLSNVSSFEKVSLQKENYDIVNLQNIINDNENIYVITNEAIIKYDLNKKVNKRYYFDDYFAEVGIYKCNDKLVAFLNNGTNKEIIILDNRLHVLNNYTVNQEVVYINAQDEMVDIITIHNIKDELVIKDSLKEEELNYNEVNYNLNITYTDVLTHSKIDLSTNSIKQYGICGNDFVCGAFEYFYFISDSSSLKFKSKEIYKYDLKSMNVIAINKIGIEDVVSFTCKKNSIEIVSNYNDTKVLKYSFDEDFKYTSNICDYSSLNNSESNILDIYLNSNKVTRNFIRLENIVNDGKLIYVTIKKGNETAFIVLDNDEIIYSCNYNGDAFLNNKYLVIVENNEIEEVITISEKLKINEFI